MGEPITLYDKNGKEITVYGQAVMNAMIAAGATLEKAKPAPDPKPAPKPDAPKSEPAKGKGK